MLVVPVVFTTLLMVLGVLAVPVVPGGVEISVPHPLYW
jgi:hypothetical protein